MGKYNFKIPPIGIRTRNIITGKVTDYESITKCARAIGSTRDTITRHLYSEKPVKNLIFTVIGNTMPLNPSFRPKITKGEVVKPQVVEEGESLKEKIGRWCDRYSVIQLSQMFGISRNEVKRLFDEWMKGRNEDIQHKRPDEDFTD